MIDLEDVSEIARIRSRLLGIASALISDENHQREAAANELIELSEDIKIFEDAFYHQREQQKTTFTPDQG